MICVGDVAQLVVLAYLGLKQQQHQPLASKVVVKIKGG